MRILSLVAAALVFASTQAGPFNAPVSLDVGRGSGEILIADVDRDGNQDIITKHLLENRITISLGDGTGKFRRGAGSMLLPIPPSAVGFAEMNGDGIGDLLVASKHGDAEHAGVYPGDGRGGFRQAALIRVHDAMPYYKPSILAADINEDGHPDLVTSNGRRGTIEFMFGDGKGGFGPVRGVALEPSQGRWWFVLADINRDKHLDIISSSGLNSGEGDGQVDVAFGNGQGQFRRQPKMIVAHGPRVEAAADVNGDGHTDVILSHSAPQITVLFNDGRGRLLPAGDSAIGISKQTHAIAAADLNGDGRVDLAAAAGDTVAVLLNTGRGFASGASTSRAGPGAFQLAVGDLNKDRKPDVIASSFEGNALSLLFAR